MSWREVIGYYVVNVGTGTVLDLSGGRKCDGNPIHGWTKVTRGPDNGNVLTDLGQRLVVGGDWDNQTWRIQLEKPGKTAREDGKDNRFYFYIRDKLDDMYVVDLHGGNSANGTPICAWKYHRGENQYWIKEDVGGGKMRFKNAQSGTYLDLENGSNGAKVRGWQYEDTDRQLWRLEEHTVLSPNAPNALKQLTGMLERGPYYIINTGTGTVLDLAGGNASSGTPIHGYAKVEAKVGGKLLSRFTGGLVKGGDWENQNWQVVGEGLKVDRHTYSIRHHSSSVVLDLSGGGTANGTPIVAWEGHGGGNQRWYMEKLGDGKCRFQNVASGTYLDLEGGWNGAKVRGWQYEDTDRQVWRLEDRTDLGN